MNENKPVTLITELTLEPSSREFCEWQAQFRSQITTRPGFISLEMGSSPLHDRTWTIKQTFNAKEALDQWQQSDVYQTLLQELLKKHWVANPRAIKEQQSSDFQTGVTEVYLTVVQEGRVAEYQQWHEKIHRAESTFPGFQKVYIQAPSQKSGDWLTLLQFDTTDNLERWLNSDERKAILDESKDFVVSRKDHRLLSSFGGWFSESTIPKWKQSAVVLLMLYPLVMLQFLYLTPLMGHLNPSIRTFVQNVITVLLLSWPFMPLAICALSWWLNSKSKKINLLGCLTLIGIYLIEVCVFWFLS